MKDELHLHKALKELEEYRAIGTVEYFKYLKELNTAKKVKVSLNEIYDIKIYCCPNCGSNLTGMGFDCCVECRQKLDWSD